MTKKRFGRESKLERQARKLQEHDYLAQHHFPLYTPKELKNLPVARLAWHELVSALARLNICFEGINVDMRDYDLMLEYCNVRQELEQTERMLDRMQSLVNALHDRREQAKLSGDRLTILETRQDYQEASAATDQCEEMIYRKQSLILSLMGELYLLPSSRIGLKRRAGLPAGMLEDIDQFLNPPK